MFKIYFCCWFEPTTLLLSDMLNKAHGFINNGVWRVLTCMSYRTESNFVGSKEPSHYLILWPWCLPPKLCRELTGLDNNQTSRDHDALFPHLQNHVNKSFSSGFKKETLPLWTKQRPALAWQLNFALISLHFRAWIDWIARHRQISRSVSPFLWRSSVSPRISIFSRFVLLRRMHCPTIRGMRTSKLWQAKEQGQDTKSGSQNKTRKAVRCYKWSLFWRTRYWYVLCPFFLGFQYPQAQNLHIWGYWNPRNTVEATLKIWTPYTLVKIPAVHAVSKPS